MSLENIKSIKLVISFPSTQSAISTETVCIEAGIKGRLIPTPREISAGCGLSWLGDVEDEPATISLLKEKNIVYEQIRHMEFK